MVITLNIIKHSRSYFLHLRGYHTRGRRSQSSSLIGCGKGRDTPLPAKLLAGGPGGVCRTPCEVPGEGAWLSDPPGAGPWIPKIVGRLNALMHQPVGLTVEDEVSCNIRLQGSPRSFSTAALGPRLMAVPPSATAA